MVYAMDDKIPAFGKDVFVADNAAVIGDVNLGDAVSIWFGVTVRADIAPVKIGRGSNIQDNSIVHVETDLPCIVGQNVTVGHGAILHGCVIADNVLIGMGAIILNGASISEYSIVAAGSVVTQGKVFPPRSLIMGSPAKVVRQVTDDDIKHILWGATRYVELANQAKKYRKIDCN